MASIVSCGRAQVRAVPRRRHPHEHRAGDLLVHVLAHRVRGDHVVAALQHERGHAAPSARSARLSDRNVTRANCAAISGSVRQKLAGQLLPQLRAVRVAHDRRRHRARPAEEVALHRLQQLLDVRRAEAADVPVVVDVARRGPDQHQLADRLRRPRGREDADHRADRVARRTPRPASSSARQDLDHVVGVAVSERVALGVVGGEVRPSGARRGRTARSGSRPRRPGATKRHMFWSQPKPWAKTIAGPSG